MSSTKPAIGSKVIVNPDVDPGRRYTGIVYTVVDHLKVNIVLEPVAETDGSTGTPQIRRPRLRINPIDVLPAPKDGTTPAVAAYQPPLPTGTVFTVSEGALRGVDGGTLLVVIGHNGPAHKAARLGGNDGRYWPKVARSAMRPVDVTSLLPKLTQLLAS